ncbi:MAG: hypothetical protein R2788_07385 [Saprospiraceae bacterium]
MDTIVISGLPSSLSSGFSTCPGDTVSYLGVDLAGDTEGLPLIIGWAAIRW